MANQENPASLLSGLFTAWSGNKATSVEPLPESGSYRQYFRISDGDRTVMGVYNADQRENQAFIYLARHLKNAGNRVPEIYCEEPDRFIYLEEDLGDITLLDFLDQVKDQPDQEERILAVYKQVIDAMPGLQIRANEDLDYTICYPRSEFDLQSMMWDMNYFKYCLLKPLKVGFYEQDLEDDFVKMVTWLSRAERNSFMFRDFQSRNIMIRNQQVYFIDFQGGRKGPLQYDLASLLYEAKTHLPEKLQEELLEYYLTVFERTFPRFNREDFLEYYYGFVYLRLMQAMGAYGFRGYIERKPLFLQSLPHAIRTLDWLLDKKPVQLELVSLPGVFRKLTGIRKIQDYDTIRETLTITISSFAYKNGVPQDTTVHGGGFVFDCRCLSNPGRQEDFRNMTGRDEAVIRFLEKDAGVVRFFSHTRHLVEQAVEDYMKRGFTSLMVSYGCTGGQHRSVYLADRLAAYLKNKYPVQLIIHHQELEKSK